jgi:hypothetical protein
MKTCLQRAVHWCYGPGLLTQKALAIQQRSRYPRPSLSAVRVGWSDELDRSPLVANLGVHGLQSHWG